MQSQQLVGGIPVQIAHGICRRKHMHTILRKCNSHMLALACTLAAAYRLIHCIRCWCSTRSSILQMPQHACINSAFALASSCSTYRSRMVSLHSPRMRFCAKLPLPHCRHCKVTATAAIHSISRVVLTYSCWSAGWLVNLPASAGMLLPHVLLQHKMMSLTARKRH